MRTRIRAALRGNQFVYSVFSCLRTFIHRMRMAAAVRKLQRMGDSQSRALAVAMNRFSEERLSGGNTKTGDWIDRIEAKRLAWNNCSDLLVDGTLGPAGVFDESKTIRDACSVSKPPLPAQLLFQIVHALRPQNVLELGTNVGISSAYMVAAQTEHIDQPTMITLDSSKYRQRLARQLHESLDFDSIRYVPGLFLETLDDVLGGMPEIELAFIDGHHQYQPTLDYTNRIFPHTSGSSVLVFDDIRWSEGMRKAWAEIRTDSRFRIVLDLYSMGVCVCSGEPGAERYVSPPIMLYS